MEEILSRGEAQHKFLSSQSWKTGPEFGGSILFWNGGTYTTTRLHGVIILRTTVEFLSPWDLINNLISLRKFDKYFRFWDMKPCTMVYTWTCLFTKLHGVKPRKAAIFKFTDVRTSERTNERTLKNFHQNANNRIHFIKKYIPSALLKYDWSLNPAFYQRFKNVFNINVIKACIFQVCSLLGW
jgi:hypothetical protein